MLSIAASALLSGAAMAEEGPPLVDGLFVDEGACPYEGCVYRDWTVKADTTLMSEPLGNQPVGTARAGIAVEGITGIVYSNPVLVQVIHETEFEAYDRLATISLSPGQEFYILTYQSEGIQRVWIEGDYYSIDTYELRKNHSVRDLRFNSCEAPTPDCWWKIAPDNRMQHQDWWAKIRLAGGSDGWTKEVENFRNKFLNEDYPDD